MFVWLYLLLIIVILLFALILQYKKNLQMSEFQDKIIFMHFLPIAVCKNKKIVYVNPAFCKLFLVPHEHALKGREIYDLILLDDEKRFEDNLNRNLDAIKNIETRMVTLDENIIDSRILISSVYFHKKFYTQYMIQNVTEEKQKLRSVEVMAYKDKLTGALNRASFELSYSELFKYKNPFVLLMFDLDGFKEINDTLGHQSGDRILQIFTDYLGKSTRSNDRIFRLGGDEFVILVQDNPSLDIGIQIATRVLNTMNTMGMWVFEDKCNVTCSIGVHFESEFGLNPDDVFDGTDRAMYVAKRSGKNNYSVF